MKVGNHIIGNNHPIFVIAEVGVNHNGDIKLAKRLIDVAKNAKADCVKFQTFHTEDNISSKAPLAEYQKKYSSASNQKELVKKLELTKDEFTKLKDYTEKCGLLFLSTPFDFKSVELLSDLNVSAFKISSGDLTNKPLLERIASGGKPIILSTGMADMKEIQEAVRWITRCGCNSYSLLQCTSSYPTEIDDCNLLTIPMLSEEFKVPIGFSDHTTDHIAAITAVGLGAKIIEKHITLDKKLPGPDHSSSLEPSELKLFIENIRNAEKALGDGVKRCLRVEEDVRKVARKSVVALKNISKGEKITTENIGIKRPGTGIEPKNLEIILGRLVNRDILEDDVIAWNDLIAE